MAIIHMDGADAVIDEADVDLVMDFEWSVHRTVNPKRAFAIGRKIPGGKKRVYLHRLILAATPGQFVDHIDGDGLNNRRSNLRLASLSHDQGDASARPSRGGPRFRGVYWDARNRRWRSILCAGGKRRHLGLFDSEEDAAAAWDAARAALCPRMSAAT